MPVVTSRFQPLLFSQLESLCEGEILQFSGPHSAITHLVIDSRKVTVSAGALFFAIKGERQDGHQFISALYEQGIRHFITEEKQEDLSLFPEGNFLKVRSSIAALQKIAAHHRLQFFGNVIGITGSNGKTIVKEWLFQLLSRDFAIAKSPGSYNSQVGVPLSVWQLGPVHSLGIFEAGISRPGEMENLERMIQPDIGIFTNIGTAHDEGFGSLEEKILEKVKLFEHSKKVIVCADHARVMAALHQKKIKTFSWGQSAHADLHVSFPKESYVHMKLNNALHSEHVQREQYWFRLPFSDAASQENILHCIAAMLCLKVAPDVIQERIYQLKSVPMRLELKQGINHCQVIDDTYNNDLGGLQISLNFLVGQQRKKKTLIISDILQSGLEEEALIRRMKEMIDKSDITTLIGIGPQLQRHAASFEIPARFFSSVEEFLTQADWDQFQNEVILVKGARAFRLEGIVRRLQKKVHGTIMEIDLQAMIQNLNFFRSRLKPNTRLMAMVKAFAYGSGIVEVASLLQYHKADYLGVAYADEGVELRKHQIALPIMVMNPSEEAFETLLDHNLEPEIFSRKTLLSLISFLDGRAMKVHLKMDTGMHRLGFEEEDIDELIQILRNNPHLEVASIFSHLAGADEAGLDDFSREQARKFVAMANQIDTQLQIKPILHLVNSAGILRLPEFQLDMVRLGIGLYGIDPTQSGLAGLQPAATLKTIISQIRKVKAGESIGYGRKGKAQGDLVVATIAIGYADGFSRAFSQGRGVVLIHGKKAPVIGNVCMDMTMVNITGIPAREGDEVIVFGRELPIQEVAQRINTIPYEILTSTSERVKRLFYTESF